MKGGCLFSVLICVAIMLAVSTISFLIDAIPGFHVKYEATGWAWIIFSILLCPFAFKLYTQGSVSDSLRRIPKIIKIGSAILFIAIFIGAFTLNIRTTLYEMYPGEIHSESDMENAMRGDRNLYIGIKYLNGALLFSAILLLGFGYFRKKPINNV